MKATFQLQHSVHPTLQHLNENNTPIATLWGVHPTK